MLRLGCLGLVLAAAGALVGCLDGRAPGGEGGETAELVDEHAGDGVEVDGLVSPELQLDEAHEVVVEPADRALCDALADRERRCAAAETVPAAFEVDACAERYACSRQLWRDELQEGVYDCLESLPCDEPDPEFTCLAEAAAEVEPTAAEGRFGRLADEANEQCGALVEVAPGQSDLVYEALSFCLAENDGCDAKAACAVATLQAVVDEFCGPTVDDEPGQDA